jgi:hypothetical protein
MEVFMKIVRSVRQSTQISLVLLLLYIFTLGPAAAAPAGASPLSMRERQDLSSSPKYAASDNLHIRDRYLLSTGNVNFIMRGVNHAHASFPTLPGSMRCNTSKPKAPMRSGCP